MPLMAGHLQLIEQDLLEGPQNDFNRAEDKGI